MQRLRTISVDRSLMIALIVIVLLFFCSLIIRSNTMRSEPLGTVFYNQEYSRWANTEVGYHVLFTLYTYEHSPIAIHKFAPYIFQQDQQDSDHFLRNKDRMNLIVYQSFSPVFFIIPYLTFIVIGAPISYTSLQIFSLFIHFLCIVLVFFLIRSLLPKRDKLMNLIPILGASVYTFSTSTLHNHMNVYWAHQLLQPFILLLLLRFVSKRGRLKHWELLIWGVLLTLINWTGFFVIAGLIAYYLFTYLKTHERRWLQKIGLITFGALVGIIALITHILITTGVDLSAYLDKMGQRAATRSLGADYIAFPDLVYLFIKNLVIDIGAYIMLALGYMAVIFKLRPRTKIDRFTWLLACISLMPLLESVLLLEHDTTYGFGRLKFVIPLILVLSIAAHKVLEHYSWSKLSYTVVCATFALAASVHIYFYQDMYGDGIPNKTPGNYSQYTQQPMKSAPIFHR